MGYIHRIPPPNLHLQIILTQEGIKLNSKQDSDGNGNFGGGNDNSETGQGTFNFGPGNGMGSNGNGNFGFGGGAGAGEAVECEDILMIPGGKVRLVSVLFPPFWL